MTNIPEDIQDDLFMFRYRSHFHLSVEEFEREPWEALFQARLIWSLEARRDNLSKGSGSTNN